MAKIRIYRSPDCARCAKIARFHKRLDWANRVELSVSTPRTGPLALGEIVVEDLSSGDMLVGFDAFAAICRAIPAYIPFRLLFGFRSFRRRVAREISGGKIIETD